MKFKLIQLKLSCNFNYVIKFLFLFFILFFPFMNRTIAKNVKVQQYSYYIASNVEDVTHLTKHCQNPSTNSFQLFSHGKSGALFINNEWKNPPQIADWLQSNKLLTTKTQLNIYGCEFAKGEKGRNAVRYLEKTLGICIAASDDITGVDGDWELEIGNSKNTVAIEEYAYNLQCNAPLPTATAYALTASCTNGTPNDDGYLQISAATNATHYEYNMGGTYAGVGFASATAFDSSTDLPLQFGTLSNPSGSQDYTIRVYNGTSDCFTDVVVTLMEQDCMANCTCDEYIYLNEPLANMTMKFKVNADGSLTEITNPDNPNNHWAEGTTIKPHGLGTDLNGFLYVGNAHFDTSDPINALGGVDKYTCDGTLVQEDYFPPAPNDGASGVSGFATNIYSIDNVIYMNSWLQSEYQGANIFAYDICTGNLLGQYTICGTTPAAWDFYINDETREIIINTYGQSQGYAIGDLDANLNGPCIPIVEGTVIEPWAGTNGITKDADGNIYRRGFNKLEKYDASNNLVWEIDLTINGGSDAFGFVYSETTGYLYLAGNDDDCIAVYTTDGEYVMQGFPNPAESEPSKAIAIIKECCPTPNRQVISQTYCVAGGNEQLFLNELFPCDGIVCEGEWVAADPASASIYNSCDQSISANIAPGCYVFTKGSDGLENYPKCGAFELRFNLEILQEPTITMSANQSVCNGVVPEVLSVTTTATDIQWQMSTTSCTDGFTNIDGATSATYTPPALNTTTYYRAIVNATGTCSTGTCPFESACITVTVDPNCVPPACTTPSAPVISVTDNDCDATTVGNFTVSTDCGAGSHIEWSTDSGATWSATTPSYSNTTVMNVIARCVDDADASCVSEHSNSVMSSPTDCGTCKPKCLKVNITIN